MRWLGLFAGRTFFFAFYRFFPENPIVFLDKGNALLDFLIPQNAGGRFRDRRLREATGTAADAPCKTLCVFYVHTIPLP